MSLNPDTRVVVCCYAGDADQINYGAMLQHGCPVTIMSPEDSPVVGDVPGVEYKFAGLRGYVGKVSLDRQHAQMKLLLETYPEKYFLLHDADSVCLDPELPRFLYEEPDLVWSNQVVDAIPQHQHAFADGWPHVAFQPPYFLSRTSMEKMVAVHDDPLCQPSPTMPFIDFYMVQLTMVAGLPWKRFLDSVSFPISIPPADHPGRQPPENYQHGYNLAYNAILNEGVNTIHSVKDPAVVDVFMEARRKFKASERPARYLVGGPPDAPTIGPRRQRQGRARAFTDPRGLKA